MTQEQTKEDFEKWLVSLSHDKLVYLDEESAWEGWQAAREKSREYLMAELPAWDNYENSLENNIGEHIRFMPRMGLSDNEGW